MDYDTALKELYSHGAHKSKLGLERIREALRSIGNPQNNVPVIHIAGTNGKGSTAAMLARILECEGHKCGLFTSPHIVDIRERLTINSEPIGKHQFAELYTYLKPVIERNNLTFFEAITLMAFVYFSDRSVAMAVLEVGLGGRLDATNVCKPIACIITNIGKDHTSILGDSIEQIATEKAGIIKAQTVVISGVEGRACEVIKASAKDLNAKVYEASALDERFEVNLKGEFQRRNAALAVKCAEILNDKGINVSERALLKGLKTTSWPGRMENINGYVLDCAHNAPAFEAISSYIQGFPKRLAIMGVLKDKNLELIMQRASEIFNIIILTTVNIERTSDPRDLQKMLSKYKTKSFVSSNLNEAFEIARQQSEIGSKVFILGSCYLVSEARRVLKNIH